MDSILAFALFAVGLVVIIKGGDWFVESAVSIAKKTGIPSIVIGATIVSFATTLPELLVSSLAMVDGFPDVALGNIIGSCICNIGLILALGIFFLPGKIKFKSFVIKGLLMISVTLFIFRFVADRKIDSLEGNYLFLCMIIYMIANLLEIRRIKQRSSQNFSLTELVPKRERMSMSILKFILGAGLVVVGAELLIHYGVEIADIIGVPKAVVSLTMIALGTSLPELVTTITAILKKYEGISVGNIIGANIINLTMALGVSAKIDDIAIKRQTVALDLPVALILMILLVVPGILKGRLTRGHGILLMVIYLCYLGILGIMFL
ncbi:MAG TPA: calcium/sodium antiporter [Clostridiales bacterium]|nr:calcium/sodium antiporter [Clostridiales bacterium]